MSLLTFACKGNGRALPAVGAGRTTVLSAIVDCSANNVAAADIVKLFDIPAGTLVQDLIAIVETAEGEALTLNLGDYLTETDAAVDADGYGAAVNANVEAATKATDTEALGYALGKYYAADSYIGALFSAAADTAVITFKAICVNCE